MLQLVRQTAALALRAPLSNTGRPLMQRAFSASSAPPSRAGHALVQASEQRGCVALGGVTNRAMTQAVQLPPMPCVVGRSLCTARALGSAAQNTASASTTLSPVLKEKRFAVVQINGKQYKVVQLEYNTHPRTDPFFTHTHTCIYKHTHCDSASSLLILLSRSLSHTHTHSLCGLYLV